jgi:hypothetical protein
MATQKQIKFKPEEYEEYLNLEDWEKDRDEVNDFKGEKEWESYWVETINAWWRQYSTEYKAITKQWDDAVSYVENVPANSFDIFVPDVAVANERIPFALLSIMEQIANIFTNYPQPAFVSPNDAEDQYAAALNQFAQIEMKANAFNVLMFDAGVDVGICSLAVLKTYVDFDETGPYGQQGKIIINKIDPSNIAFDPTARSLNWQHLRYIIHEEYIDLGEARKQYKSSAYKIESYFQEADKNKHDDGMYGFNLTSPVPNPIEGNASNRNKVKIQECWFKDDRQFFQAETEAVDNRQFIPDDNNPTINKPNAEYNSDKPETYTRPKLDEAGFVVGDWVPAYPHGRCVVIAGNKSVIRNFANPYWHKRAPFVFLRGRPSKRLITTGDLMNIIRIDKKLNDIYARIHIMSQQEIERPIIAEVNTFRTPRAWFRMSGQASAVIVKNPGREFGRMPPTEIPQFVFVYIQLLEKALDKCMAVAGVMQGKIAEGSQLSAEAMQSIQGMATAVLKMKAELIAEGMKELGYQLMWLIRETYPQDIKVKITLPDGQTKEVNWNDDDAANDYLVDIDSASGLAGGHQANFMQTLQMYRENLIDQPAALQALRYGNWSQIVSRMQKQKEDDIKSAAAGRAMGVEIKQMEKKDESAGRKQKL